uniref:polysaccharide deacetylase family protein n=1 Tax=Ningiella ruwaisensis TaxID=2364274 RepID=UPI001F4F257F|nr:polysaccharide deacetylase family protein [Ningiella ruwaisensis]
MHRMHQGSALHQNQLEQPLLIVVVDTEEEFDWTAPPDRNETGVSHMQHVHLTHDICVEYGLSPCYVVDYPIASKPDAYQILQDFKNKSQCEIGAHLHPWVTPPMIEELSVANMYPGNLPEDIEYKKLASLVSKIQENFSDAPTSYKAGRYGFGPHTLKTIEKLGFTVDLSYCPPINHSADGGPDYSRCNSNLFRFDNSHILGIPITGAFTGMLGKQAPSIFELSQKFEAVKLPGILSRLNILDRLILSPEGYTSDEHIKLTNFLYNQGQRVFTWSFHSPTVVPGHTEYVQSKQDQHVYLDKFKRFFDFFFNTLNGRAATPAQIYKMMEK